MVTSWRTSCVGLALIFLAIGGMALAGLDKLTAGVLITAGLGFLSAKDYNVHGGTVPQATPPAVQAQAEAAGVVLVAKTEADKKP